jgi:uncharacterized protein (TIGR00269 family)
LFAYYKNFPFHSVDCPYASESMRRNIKDAMALLEEKNPSVKFNLLNFMNHVFPKKALDLQEFNGFKICKNCKEPTSSDVCKFCELMEKLT